MTTYRPGELLLTTFPFVSQTQAKTRPALVLVDTGNDDVFVARITSRSPKLPFEVAITDWKGAGLLAPSKVRLHKLATLEKMLIHRTIGQLQATDHLQVSGVLQLLFGNW